MWIDEQMEFVNKQSLIFTVFKTQQTVEIWLQLPLCLGDRFLTALSIHTQQWRPSIALKSSNTTVVMEIETCSPAWQISHILIWNGCAEGKASSAICSLSSGASVQSEKEKMTPFRTFCRTSLMEESSFSHYFPINKKDWRCVCVNVVHFCDLWQLSPQLMVKA